MYYKSPDNKLHFISPEHAYLLPAGLVQVTDDEAEVIRVASLPTVDPKTVILNQIRAIEAEGADDQARMNRIVSLESCLKWAMEQPAAAGLTKEQVHTVLMGQNLGYARLYAKEQQIALLRAQL